MLYIVLFNEETHCNNAAYTVHDAMTHTKILMMNPILQKAEFMTMQFNTLQVKTKINNHQRTKRQSHCAFYLPP